MSNFDNEWKEEQSRVNRLGAIIERRVGALEGQSAEAKDEIVDIKRNFWSDVTVNFEDSVETAETHASIKQQSELLSERERRSGGIAQQLETLGKLKQSPYFGRIDFAEEGETGEAIYLGIASLLDDAGNNYLVYDWRAPVSSLYYDCGPGPAVYETPGGTIRGEMTLKRQYIIRGGQIKSMFDTGETIGDELLKEVLGKASDASMKSIVATIQREQNRIIRNERARLLIVQGAAGSGKTSAALQRAAYLLYRHRDSLNASQIVLFSPNQMFSSYVATVLPELGEQNMQQATYQQYLDVRLGRSYKLETPFVQMEYTLTKFDDPAYDARMASVVFKSGASFMERIDAYVKALGERGMRFRPVKFRGETLISGADMAEQFYKEGQPSSIPNRIRALSGWLLKQLTALGKREQAKEWVDQEIELLDRDDYMEAYEHLRSKRGFTESSFHDFDDERDFLAAKVVQKQFKKLRRRVKLLKFLHVDGMYADLFKGKAEPGSAGEALGETGLPDHWEDICSLTLRHLQDGVMLYEDATPYLYLKEKLEGFHTNTTVKHLFIDEAQDYSAFQFHYLKHIFPNCKMTVLGDSNQSIFAHSGTGDGFHSLAGLFGESFTESIHLSRSYRSTEQIVRFTSRMIPGGGRIEPFSRGGKEPTVAWAEDEAAQIHAIGGKLKGWLSEGYASVAVICKTAAESACVHERLAGQLEQVKLVKGETADFGKGAVVIPSYLAKGVEFDAVVVCNASDDVYGRESERKLFYTVCTRAMHELHIVYTGKLTRFLENKHEQA